MSILLVGCGYWGQNWAATLASMGELGAVCEPSYQNTLRFKETFGNINTYENLEDALAQQGIEAAVIATPATSHFQLACLCLEQGKSVLVEKPLTLHPDEAEQLVALAEERGLTLAVGHLLTYHPALLKLKTLIQKGVLGDILGVECVRINMGKVRTEENVWWSLAPHDLSIVDMLLDEPFYPVSACKRNLLRRPTIEDEVYAHLVSRSGISISIQVSWLSPIKRHETIIIGSEKIAIFEDTLPDGQELKLVDYQFEQDSQRFGSIQKGDVELVAYAPVRNLLHRQAEAFLAAVRGDASGLINDGESGRRIIQLLADVQELLRMQDTRLPVLV